MFILNDKNNGEKGVLLLTGHIFLQVAGTIL